MALNKLGMIILMQTEFEAAVEFYKKLGIPLKFHLKNQWAEFAIGDVKLGLCPVKELAVKQIGVVFEVADLRAEYEKMKADGVQFVTEPIEKVHGIMVSFKDPSGNIIDLYQPTPEKVKEMVRKAAEGDRDKCCGKSTKCCKIGQAKAEA